MRGTKLPMVEPGKKPSLGRPAMLARKVERPGESATTGLDLDRGEALVDLGRAFAKIVAGNVDRHIGRGVDRFEQQRRLGRRAGAELDDRRAGGMRAAISGMISSSSAVSVRVG